LYRVKLIMDRGSGTGQIINLINLEQYWFDYVVSQQFKAPVIQQVKPFGL